jgi:hypothetical protein
MGANKNMDAAGRRALVAAAAVAAAPALPGPAVQAALDATAATPAALRELAAAVAADPAALAAGAPPVVGRLVTELIARGAALPPPTCARCGRVGRPLTRSAEGGVCEPCRRRQLAAACARCAAVRPVARRDGEGRPVCARCADRPRRPCGICGDTRRISRRARGDCPDVCVNCYRRPEATCSGCGRRRPCAGAGGDRPLCATCTPRASAPCAHCGALRPPTARWPEGPVCDPCYTAALQRRGGCAACGTTRRLVHPPGPAATTCADCAGLPTTHTCTDCGTEDKAYERGRCARCSLARRAGELLRAGAPDLPAELAGVYQAVCAARTPRSALNWLRKGAGAALLADLAAGRLPATHDALDAHPRPRAADYLRALLAAHGVLPARDEALARAERRLAAELAEVAPPACRRLLSAYTAWRVLRRLRRSAERPRGPRTHTRHAELHARAAIGFLRWLHDRGTALSEATQHDVDLWLATGPAARHVRDFLDWAAEHGHARPLAVPAPRPRTGAATGQDRRAALLARLLHDDALDLTDRVAGAVLLLYGQQLSRITALTTEHVACRDGTVFLRLGPHEVAVPEPLATLILDLRRDGRRHVGVGSPPASTWLIPGLLPGRPLTPDRLGSRLRKLGVYAMAGRRAALTQLAAELPAAVLADLLGLHPNTAADWVSHAGGSWNRYAAELARARVHQP